MTVLVQLEVVAQPGKTRAVSQMLAETFPDTRAFEGCKDITAWLNEDGVTFVFVEHWKSKAHYEKYIAWRRETGALDALGALVTGPPNIRFFEKVEA